MLWLIPINRAKIMVATVCVRKVTMSLVQNVEVKEVSKRIFISIINGSRILPLPHNSTTPPPTLLQPSSTPPPPLLHPSYTPPIPLLHPSSTPPPPFLHPSSTPPPPLLHPSPTLFSYLSLMHGAYCIHITLSFD